MLDKVELKKELKRLNSFAGKRIYVDCLNGTEEAEGILGEASRISVFHTNFCSDPYYLKITPPEKYTCIFLDLYEYNVIDKVTGRKRTPASSVWAYVPELGESIRLVL